MANPFAPAQLDFSMLANLPAQFETGQQLRQNKDIRDVRKSLRNGEMDYGSAFEKLLLAGDTQGANALTSHVNSLKQGQMTPAQSLAERRFQYQMVQDQREANQPPSLSATDKRALYKAEDEVPAVEGTIDNLKRAFDINDKTFSGTGASTRAYLGSKLPDMAVPDFIADPKTANTTTEWQSIMSPSALSQMSETLKGATTDFELRKFESMLADPSTPADVRKGIIERMLKLAERQLDVKRGRIGELRGTPSSGNDNQPPAHWVQQQDGSYLDPNTNEVYDWVE